MIEVSSISRNPSVWSPEVYEVLSVFTKLSGSCIFYLSGNTHIHLAL